MNFDEKALLASQGAYETGVTRTTPSFSSLKVYCRGVEDQLRELIAPTPFELESDTIMFSCEDQRSREFFKGDAKLPYHGYIFAKVSALVRYGDHVGGWELTSYSDQWRNIKGSAQFLGSYKNPADISMESTSNGLRATISGGVLGHGEGRLMTLGIEDAGAEHPISEFAWPKKYFTLRMLPRITGERGGLDLLEVYALEGGTLSGTDITFGNGFVDMAPSVLGTDLKIQEVLGASLTEGSQHFGLGEEGYTYELLQRTIQW